MQNKQVLICDDDQDNLDVLELLLELHGYIVIKENDSTKLIKRIKEDCPDILLLDLWMPEICGDELIKIIRVDSKLKELPVIAFSASYDGEQIAFESGADYYISKPFNIDEITDIFKQILT